MSMSYTRREFGRLALAGLPAAAVVGSGESIFGALLQTRPNSLINGVQIGTITYSYRSMPDQSAEAILRYVLDSGISGIELMGAPVESFAGAPSSGQGGGGGRGAGRGSGAAAGGAAGGGSAGAGGAAAAPAAVAAGAAALAPPPGSWNGQPCPAGRGGGGGGRNPAAGAAAAGTAPNAEAVGRGRGRGEMSPEQQEAANSLRAWRTSVSMDAFKKLRTMYNEAGVTIYAWKLLSPNMTDEEFEYVFNVAEALGCTHTTLELPTDDAQLKRIGEFATKKKIYAAYHTHTQGSMTAFDKAFALSKGNMANVDFGHWVAAGNVGGTPMQFLEKYHDRIASFHLKDRTTPEHCALNLPWGTGETPIKDILQMVSRNQWKIPASIELEYAIPDGSDAVRETRKCVEYCRAALTDASAASISR
jgi:sugar phosphate isomerase/epimerase